MGVGEVGGVQGGLVLVQGDGGQARHDSVPALSQDPQDDLQLLRGAEQYIHKHMHLLQTIEDSSLSLMIIQLCLCSSPRLSTTWTPMGPTSSARKTSSRKTPSENNDEQHDENSGGNSDEKS